MKQDLKKKEDAIEAYQQLLDSWSEKFQDLMTRQKDVILNLNYDDNVENEEVNELDGGI
jgi:hypothetical protein